MGLFWGEKNVSYQTGIEQNFLFTVLVRAKMRSAFKKKHRL